MNKRLICFLALVMVLCLSLNGLAEEIDYSEYIFCEDIAHFTPDPYHLGQYPANTPAPAATGGPITVDGNAMTRDLLFDKHTNKQFVTLETRKGNPFFLVIDYDKPKDAAGEQFDTFFLNKVDEADLMSLLDDEEKEGMNQPCNCKTQCQAGAVNTACPVCKKDMTECKGAAPTPPPKPVTTPTPETVPVPENKGAGMAGPILLAVLVLAGGAVFFFLKRKGTGKGKQTQASAFEDDYDDSYEDEDEETDETDDGEDTP